MLNRFRLMLPLTALCAPVLLAGCADDAARQAPASLSADQCDHFAVNGRVTICHATGSARNPYTLIRVAEAACVNGHSGHAGDYVSTDGTCGPNACLPVGGPVDATLGCCAGLVVRGGVCVDLCAGVTCAASDGCHLAGACNPATGACSNPSAPNGTACSDGSLCTSGDACTGGSCVGATVAIDDGNPCTADACSPAGGVTHAPLAAGTACGDGDSCNGHEVCDGAGVCVAGTPVATDDANPCTADSCNATTGLAEHTPVADGLVCDDGDACTQADACRAGACRGSAVVCGALDACHAAGTCNPMSGACSNPVAADGTACGAGLTCGAGVCGCPTGQTQCGPACVDLASDADHCGGCGVVCADAHGTAVCNAGHCGVSACAPGYASDGTRCVDVDECAPVPAPVAPTCSWNVGAQNAVNELAGVVANPSGAWTYFYGPSAGAGNLAEYVSAAQVVYSAADHTNAWYGSPTLRGYVHNFAAEVPMVVTNTSPNPGGAVTPYGAHVNFGELLYHPGPTASGGRYNTIRWTSPAAGTYRITAAWRVAHGAQVDWAILRNHALPAVATGRSPSSYAGTLALNAGDTLDFAIGFGSDFGGATTGIGVQVQRTDGGCPANCVDANNNGVCDEFDLARPSACGAGLTCVNTPGSFRCDCPSGQDNCGGTCRTLASDNAHCGACGNVCPGGATCTSGVCVSPPVVTPYVPGCGEQIVVVPAGVTRADLRAWGAGGGGAYNGLPGGSGSFVGVDGLSVVAGQTLRVRVGGGGTGRNGVGARRGLGGCNGGGNGGGNSDPGVYRAGGGGGGLTSIYLDGALVLVAGGGGGAGSLVHFQAFINTHSGGGGGDGDGVSAPGGSTAGLRGTTSAGGAGGASLSSGASWFGLAGVSFAGGNSGCAGESATIACGGGGGGGLFGGGGGGGGSYLPGGDNGGAGSGGGGGSSYVNSGLPFASSSILVGAASGGAPGGNADALYVSGVGAGAAPGANGGPGRAVVTFAP